MQPIIEEIVNLSMWTVATATLSLAAGVKLGSKLQRWMNLDESTTAEQHYEFGFEDGIASATHDAENCPVCEMLNVSTYEEAAEEVGLRDQLVYPYGDGAEKYPSLWDGLL
jgi:hypothetical protein